MGMKFCLGGLVVACLASLISGIPTAVFKNALQKTSCNCGWVNRGRIVGGKETFKNEYPPMVSIQAKYFNMHVCGGTILTPWHVLTAAHCTEPVTEDDIALLVGAHDMGEAEDVPRIGVSKIINHEGYDSVKMMNDIALIVPEERLPFSRNVGPICTFTNRVNLVGQKITALGWGLTTNRGKSATRLQSVDLTVVSHTNCSSMWADAKTVRKPQEATNMCTFQWNKDTCKGDSGGPLLWLDPEIKRYTIVSLVSFGSICGGKRPAVNTDVTAYSDWINNAIAGTNPEVSSCSKTQA